MREQKYHLLRAKYDNFKMLGHESCNAMYSRLNVLIKDINALEISTLVEGDINRKILMLLPKPKYNIINSMLQKENLDGMEVSELIGEIRAHEMSVLGMLEETAQVQAKARTLHSRPRQRRVHPRPSSPQSLKAQVKMMMMMKLQVRKMEKGLPC